MLGEGLELLVSEGVEDVEVDEAPAEVVSDEELVVVPPPIQPLAMTIPTIRKASKIAPVPFIRISSITRQKKKSGYCEIYTYLVHECIKNFPRLQTSL
ncbi:hypothetical protein CDI07_00480 [Thermococcus sp. 5-4]|nr:hypothetical protein CDI07_00480 [Thermococcus sp. 5-4]